MMGYTSAMRTFIRKNARLLAKYATTGSTGFGIDILAFTVLMNSVGMHYLAATILGFFIGSSVHFLLSKKFVFKGAKRPTRDSYVLFLAVAGASVSAISTLMYLAVGVLGTPPLFARVGVGASVGFVAYLLHKHYSFRYEDGVHTPSPTS